MAESPWASNLEEHIQESKELERIYQIEKNNNKFLSQGELHPQEASDTGEKQHEIKFGEMNMDQIMHGLSSQTQEFGFYPKYNGKILREKGMFQL